MQDLIFHVCDQCTSVTARLNGGVSAFRSYVGIFGSFTIYRLTMRIRMSKSKMPLYRITPFPRTVRAARLLDDGIDFLLSGSGAQLKVGEVSGPVALHVAAALPRFHFAKMSAGV
ncbi:hypothetical protein SCHPADRAFT_892201 [Schizopora paradoxa]|uniref:Uncharacterized protein n=1 Tax=Schizopora paradoxa TaxID=27342 RepID=A0A0H2RFP1_9AGAM|nr:hypothetical protein SCHPADRAFT_892201 [Schizopora paradoxa]